MKTGNDICAMPKNYELLIKICEAEADGSRADGLSYQLYLDLDDNELIEYCEASDQTWHERADGTLLSLRSLQQQTGDREVYEPDYSEFVAAIERVIDDVLRAKIERESAERAYAEQEQAFFNSIDQLNNCAKKTWNYKA